MKIKEYLDKNTKLIEPLEEYIPLKIIFGILESVVVESSDEAFRERFMEFIDKEMDLLANKEIKE